ncbi:hypothetical protein, partial [Burkholderia sp. Ap-962]|uniref:hypothetical protein n=1 Tax=Burkholderia sp. Ap-962 TaxID=2608333 RepID=UPI0019656C31
PRRLGRAAPIVAISVTQRFMARRRPMPEAPSRASRPAGANPAVPRRSMLRGLLRPLSSGPAGAPPGYIV